MSRPEDARLLEDRPEMRLVGGMDAVEDRLDVALDDGERRPELVGDVGEEAPPLGLVRLEPGGHRVEAAGQVADRLGHPIRRLDPRRVVAGLDARRLLDEVVEDGPGPPDGQPATNEAGEDRDAATPSAASRMSDAERPGRVEDVADEPGRQREHAEDPGDEQRARTGSRSRATDAGGRPAATARRPATTRAARRGPTHGRPQPGGASRLSAASADRIRDRARRCAGSGFLLRSAR